MRDDIDVSTDSIQVLGHFLSVSFKQLGRRSVGILLKLELVEHLLLAPGADAKIDSRRTGQVSRWRLTGSGGGGSQGGGEAIRGPSSRASGGGVGGSTRLGRGVFEELREVGLGFNSGLLLVHGSGI